jgi:hypothetical protein
MIPSISWSVPMFAFELIHLAGRPLPDEISVIFCIANRGRIGARVGGLKFEDMTGEDGLL